MMVGWGYATSGALGELEVSYALALVAALLESPDDFVVHLRPNPKGFYRDARKHLAKARRADVDRLRSVVGLSHGPYR